MKCCQCGRETGSELQWICEPCQVEDEELNERQKP